MSTSPSPRSKLPRTPQEVRKPKKCAHCGIRLDVPCTNPACDGHHNDSRGDVCVYCATNERTHIKPRHDLRYTRVHFSRPYRSVK
jgi:hypothetical protein